MHTTEAPVHEPRNEIHELRDEIDDVDTEIIALLQRRMNLSHQIGAARSGDGGTRLSLTREGEIIRRYSTQLGPEGAHVAMALLRQGRGRL